MTSRFAVPLFVKSRAGADRKMHVTPRPLDFYQDEDSKTAMATAS